MRAESQPEDGVGEGGTIDLRSSRDRLARFFDLALEFESICDIDGRYLEVNPAHERLLGWTPAEMLGRNYLHFVHPEDRPALIAESRRLAAGEVGQLWCEIRFLRADGEYRWIRASASALPDDGLVYAVGMDVTDRRHGEEELRARTRFIETVLDTIREGIAACDPDGALTYLNRAAAEMYAVDALPSPPDRWTADVRFWADGSPEPLPPDDLPLARALRGEEFRDQSYVAVGPDGARRSVVVSGLPLVDGGQRLGAVVAFRDVSHELESELERRRLAALIEHSRDLVGMADVEGRVMFLNAAAMERLGLDRDPTTTRVPDYYDPEDWSELMARAGPALREHGSWQGRSRLRHFQTGERIDVDLTIFRIDDPGTGESACYATIQRDITEQLQAEETVRRMQERERQLQRERDHLKQVQALTRASMQINARLSLQEVIDEVTHQAAELIGAHQAMTCLTADGPWERAMTSVYLSDRYAEWRTRPVTPPDSEIHAAVRRRNEPVRLTERELQRNPAWLGLADHPHHPPLRGLLIAPLTGRHGDNLGIIQLTDRLLGDFTETDEALLLQIAQIAATAVERTHLQTLAAAQETARFREELLAGISHDMQTPLASISGLSELLNASPDLPLDERVEIYDTLARQSRTLHGLVQQFLDYSRLEADRELIVRLRPTDVVAAIDRVVELFGHHREIVVGASLELPPVIADPDRLDQVLTNLVSNAIKFSEGPIRVVARPHRDRVRIDVVDEGAGIPTDDLGHLFRKFHRGSNVRSVPGTGLGLYITRAVIEAMDGTLTVRSREGEGTRFTVDLPADIR